MGSVLNGGSGNGTSCRPDVVEAAQRAVKQLPMLIEEGAKVAL